MKIIQLVTKRQYRGAEVFAANLSKELLKENIDIIFAGLYSPPDKALRVDGAQNIDLNGSKAKLVSWALLQNLLKLIKTEKPDIIQANGSDTLKYAALVKLFFPQIPVTYRNISIISTWIGGNKLKLAFYKRLFSPIDHITCVGHVAREDIISTIGFSAEDVSVINRGIPIQQIDKASARQRVRSSYGLAAQDQIIVHVGNFSPEKNHAFLIDVMEKLRAANPSLKLLLLGEGLLEDEIKAKVRDRRLSDTIFFGGFNSSVQDVIAGCDLFALCSLIEGVPGVILEAAAQKVPAIAVNVGGVSEVVRDGVTGVLVQDHDSDTFAENILSLLRDKSRMEKLSNAGFEMVKEEYDPKTNVHKFINLYKSLLNKHGK
ncbi:glycosyltransferase family 4 protein [Pontibacter ramchanderi]|uniref:Glycosyltransferase involved in cell wall biosynthesis n=1 Tax=Pontibacter ramchanderi TaxID=1179743 RepID=A0A2N3U8Y7_9BACT|nr:glycosyltransferase family 4 protein [Pontibacter ramchanderi]PKV63218.1 glycosyltransferase involved in cell wall biosynthesis [Pontibacter ramchanderi]